MLFRNCAGGVVFHGNKVFILKNEKNEWVLPKGRIRNGYHAAETAIKRVKDEANIEAKILSAAGETNYEFYSFSRQRPVTNEITWYIMQSEDENYKVNKNEGFMDGGYFTIKEAIEKVTHNQEKALVSLSYKKFVKLKEELVIA